MKLFLQKKPIKIQDPAAAAAGFPLAEVGRIDIEPALYRHRHMFEAQANAMVMDDGRIEAVVGTTNVPGQQVVELYGWGRNVDSHVDETGWIYFAPLICRRSLVYIEKPSIERPTRVCLQAGKVYRLNDYVLHWTRDRAAVVCLFAGVFDRPDDAKALTMLAAGAKALAHKTPGAPRVKSGFQTPFPDECYADTGDGVRLVLKADAKANDWLIAHCTECRTRAIRLDNHWPWMSERNACEKHLEAEEATA